MTIATQPVSKRIQATADDDHEQVVIRQEPETGLRFIVAVHSTVLGPALGGMRLKRYPGGLREALEDVMGLARTMTLKASAAGLDLGGGKAVMIDDGQTEMRRARLEGAGRTIEALDGSDELERRRIGVIGLGKVGGALAARLAGAGARVVACDLDSGRCERFAAEHGAEIAPSAEAIVGLELDVLAPCAAGGLIDEALARSIDVGVVAGAANNPLTSRAVARILAERGILYVPDFLANCGGLIHVSGEWYGGRR